VKAENFRDPRSTPSRLRVSILLRITNAKTALRAVCVGDL